MVIKLIDTKTLRYLTDLSDDKLEQMIRLFASGCGAELSKNRLNKKTLSGLRAAMSQVDERDIERAGELISVYRKGKKI